MEEVEDAAQEIETGLFLLFGRDLEPAQFVHAQNGEVVPSHHRAAAFPGAQLIARLEDAVRRFD